MLLLLRTLADAIRGENVVFPSLSLEPGRRAKGVSKKSAMAQKGNEIHEFMARKNVTTEAGFGCDAHWLEKCDFEEAKGGEFIKLIGK